MFLLSLIQAIVGGFIVLLIIPAPVLKCLFGLFLFWAVITAFNAMVGISSDK